MPVRRVEVGGTHLEVVEWPAAHSGRPSVVLLHEGLGSVSMWREFPAQVAAGTGCRTVAWSRAGYGGSDAARSPRTPQYLHTEALEALPAFLAAMELERPVLVGHSDGASIALIYAGTFPDGPAGVVAMSPHEFVEEATLEGLRAAREAWDKTAWRTQLARHHRDALRVFHDWNDTWLSPEFLDWNIEDMLDRIRCPILAIQGEEDAYASMRQIDVIAARAPRAALLKLARCGHAPHRDQTKKVLDALVAFVAAIETSGAAGFRNLPT